MKHFSFIPCRAWLFVLATAVILPGRAAQAELIFTNIYDGPNFTIQVSNPVELAGTTLEAVTLRAVGKNGALPNTFDSNKSGRGGTGITATALHEIWPYNSSLNKTPTLDMDSDPENQFNQALDTHFLVYSDNLATVKSLSEDRVSNHQYDAWGGYGTYLKGTFTDLTATNSTWDFAYLVAPSGTRVSLDFEIGAAGFDSGTVSGSFVVPEPSSLILLTAGAFGLLAYRRRFGR